MTAKNLSICIPFSGFYESLYSSAIDQEEEQFCENEAEYRQAEEGIPPELHLTASEFAEELMYCVDYRAVHLAVAQTYVDAFNNVASEAIGIPLGLMFEEMTSPREYNFETDRIFCEITPATVRALFAQSAADGHAALEAQIRRRFTSYDGFISGYPNALETWLEKPLDEWDHNELGTLLLACLDLAAVDDLAMDVYYAATDCDSFYHEWSNGVDWPKFEARVAEIRADKEAEARDDPAYLPPAYRCPLTLDLFR